VTANAENSDGGQPVKARLCPNRRRLDSIRRTRAGILFPAAGEAAFSNDVYVTIARHLATQPKAMRPAQATCLQNRSLGLRNLVRLSGDETHPAGGASGVPAAGMKLIDFCLID
jgi:hypothetical protein